jgi:ATP-dependent DNA helicase Rep
VIPLEQNYRSTGRILRAANHVIAANPKLFEKKLWSEYGDGEPVACRVRRRGARGRARGAAAGAARGGAPGGRGRRQALDWKDFAILYRANHQARVLEQALRARRSRTRSRAGRATSTRRDQGPVRVAAAAGEFGRRPGLPARGGHAQARHRPPDAGRAGRIRGALQDQPVQALFAESLHTVLSAKHSAGLHEFGRYVNDLEHRRATPPAARTRARCCSAG